MQGIVHGQRGRLAQCREKFGPRPIFKIFSLDQIRVDQEKKPFFLDQREFGRARKFWKSAAAQIFLCTVQGSPADRALWGKPRTSSLVAN